MTKIQPQDENEN